MSACGLFAAAYKASPAGVRAELRTLYSSLVRDDTPMTRRAAAQTLGKVAAVIEPEYIKGDIMPLFTELTQDGARSHPPAAP